MGLYRADPKDGVADHSAPALAGHWRSISAVRATPSLLPRDEDRLATLADEAQSLPGRAISFPCDVTDDAAMLKTVAAIEKEAGPIVLAVYNAGTYFPTGRTP
jgi:NADP-dependent 3-hydroxy acid dehydrogenase YdfG